MLRQITLLCLSLLVCRVVAAHEWDGEGEDGKGRKGKRDRNPEIDKHVFESVCLHPGIEQGMSIGDELTYINDITSMDDNHVTLRFATFFHAVRFEICQDDSKITGMQLSTGLRATTEEIDEDTPKIIMMQRIGSDQGCETLYVGDDEFISEIYVKANQEYVKYIAVHMSNGNKYEYGKQPIIDAAFNHTVFEFSDSQRFLGLYGHETETEDGDKQLVGVGFFRNDCEAHHIYQLTEKEAVAAIVIFALLVACIGFCCLYTCLKYRGRLCPKKRRSEKEIQLPSEDKVTIENRS